MNSRFSEYISGAKAILPLWIGVCPFGMIYGVTALKSGLTCWQAQAMSSLVFAGASQMVLCQLITSSAPLLVIFFTISIINLRHILYSASIAPTVKDVSPWWKICLSYFLTDEAYVTSIGYLQSPHTDSDGKKRRHWFLLGAGSSLWFSWQISTLLGILLGERIPASWGLDFAAPLTFIALVVPKIKTRADWVAIAVTGVSVVVFASLPFKLALIFATLLGVFVGVLLMKRREV